MRCQIIFGEATETEEQWYQRVDNNEWRPIIPDKLIKLTRTLSRQLSKQYRDKYHSKSVIKPEHTFHFSKLQREADKRNKIKQTKIKWLKQVYHIAADQVGLLSIFLVFVFLFLFFFVLIFFDNKN